MKTVAIVQARMESTRFPGKVMKVINGVPLIGLLLSRLSKSTKIDQLIVATPKNSRNYELNKYLKKEGYSVFEGSENNVLNRYYEAAKEENADAIVRITGDCPLIDVQLVDEFITHFHSNTLDYVSNIEQPSFPDGLDIEVFSFESLKDANNLAKSDFEIEHVTPYIRNLPQALKASIANPIDYSKYRWTVDEPEDFIVVKEVFNHFAPDIYFDWNKILLLQEERPDVFDFNKHIKNNEGSIISNGQKLYKRAKKIIPGGNMLLSKRPEMFLPEIWPSYYSKSKGCKVWDLDGKEFIDMSIMGIGTNTLGYGHPEVDEAVIKAIKDGNMSTLNCPEEVYLAEKLVDMHPWADMVRFARAGGEINSVAVRIARAATGRDKIVICGYHGWHDWYLSTNLSNNKNLDGHLLPGLEPKGVPRSLIGSTIPFKYNDIEDLEKIIINNHGEIAAIKMEVTRSDEPKDNFLQKVRDLATDNNIVLIFDECTSGFRETFGGLHKKYNIEPDLALFAKALGNGYAISSCIGRQEIMKAVQKTFISSTFWTERIGPAAALKTLEVMEREQSWNKITKTGNDVSNRWKLLAKKYDLQIDTWGLPALSGFTIKSVDAIKYKTYITQEMLKKGYLASNVFYSCIEHSSTIVDGYFDALDSIFETIHACEESQKNINNLLDGPVCHSGFSRLND
jgi:glutamate-1-semialdehyde 2,1-aminomutase